MHHFRKRLTYTATVSCRSLILSHGVEPWFEVGGMETEVTAYFPTLTIGAQNYDFAHLEPFNFTIASQLAKRDLRVHVTFSSHCFSEGYDAGINIDRGTGGGSSGLTERLRA